MNSLKIEKNFLNIIVFDVGHGDSILLYIPAGNGGREKWGVIDCNKYPQEDLPKVLEFLKKNGIDELEFIWLTHPHTDHFVGMDDILKYFLEEGRTVRNFYHYGFQRAHLDKTGSYRGRKKLGEIYKLILKHRDEKGLSIRAGSMPVLSKMYINDAIIIPLSPSDEDVSEYNSHSNENINRLSAALAIIFKEKSFLFCGDAETKSIKRFLSLWDKSAEELQISRNFCFLKVSHHGSKNGHCDTLYDGYGTRQSVSVISCGARRNIPHKEVTRFIADKCGLYMTNVGNEFIADTKEEENIGAGYLQKAGLHNKSINTILNNAKISGDDVSNAYHGTCLFNNVENDGRVAVIPQNPKGVVTSHQLTN